MKKLTITTAVIAALAISGWWFTRSAPDSTDDDGRDDFYKTLDTEPAPVLTPDQALEQFSIAPGFEIELVAAEPMVEDPVAMAWDEYERLYVVEMRGYMPDAFGNGKDEPVGRVVRLTDVDGDGRMDESEVFLDKLVNPRAVAVTNDGILIGVPPDLLLCELNDPADLCTSKRRVGDYAPNFAEGNVEYLENGLLAGIDNWLYSSQSERSLRLENGRLEERVSPPRGQWGIARDDHGRLFYNNNSIWVQADLFAGEDLVEAGREGDHLGLGVTLSEDSEVFSVRVNPGVNRAYLEGTLRPDGRLHNTTGVSGLAVYRGEQFPPDYAGDVFVPEVAANAVAHLRLNESGMNIEAEHVLYDDAKWGQREFLASTDERFRPVDAFNGPDGALYIVDMYRGIVQDVYFLTDELREQILQRQLDKPVGKGRIWRVKAIEGTDTGSRINLATADSAALIEVLSGDNGWQRDTAQRLLLARPGDLNAELAELASGDNTIAAGHALWTLAGRGELSADLVMQVAQRDDAWRQLQALRAGGQLLQESQMLALAQFLADAPERVQLQLAFEMGQFAGSLAVREQLRDNLYANLDSALVRQAVVRALRGHEMTAIAEMMADPRLDSPAPATEVIAALAANAYRDLRADLASTEPANPQLNELLAMAARANEPQQIAIMNAFRAITLRTGFAPAGLAAMPALFDTADTSASEALAQARLSGRRAFTWPGDPLALGIEPLTREQQELMSAGEVFYGQCASCHDKDGSGTPGLAPALAGSEWITGAPEWLGRIILQGKRGSAGDGVQYTAVMPPHGHLEQLDDATLAGLMTYLRRAWGNAAAAVSVEKAAAIRSNSADRTQPWTPEELRAVYVDRGYGKFVGEYSVSFITITIEERPEGLHMDATVGGGGLLNRLDDQLFEIQSDDGSIRVEFVSDANGAVNELIIYRDGQKIPATRDE